MLTCTEPGYVHLHSYSLTKGDIQDIEGIQERSYSINGGSQDEHSAKEKKDGRAFNSGYCSLSMETEVWSNGNRENIEG